MRRLFLRILVPFAVALLAGLAVGGRSAEREPARLPSTKVKVRVPVPASRPQASGLNELLERYVADEQLRDESDADPLLDHVADWTDEELAAALTEALRLPRCMDSLGRDERLLRRLYRAWMERNPDAAAAWIETVPSSMVRDELVRVACRYWPADRPMDGIDFLLANHWRAGASGAGDLLQRALESQALQGSGAVDQLLRRLADAKVGVSVEALDFPSGFDFAGLVDGEGFSAQLEPAFRDPVMKEWRSDAPAAMLDWMARTANWESFHDFIAEQNEETPRFWDAASPESRKAALGKIRWSEVDGDLLDRFAGQLHDAEGKAAFVTGYFNSGAIDDRLAVLELIPSAQARLDILTIRYPEIDWRPDAVVAAGEPAWVPAMRDAVRDWKVVVPPPAPDPFGTP